MSKARDLANLGSNTAALATDSEVTAAVAPKADTTAVVEKSVVDAKGDLIVGSASDTVARLGVGTNDHVLTADSSAANGVKWAALPASGKTYTVQTFNSTQSWTVPASSTGYIDIFMQAGGGGGGRPDNAAGAAAGGGGPGHWA